MSEELQEIIDNNPEWYRELQYKDVKVFIQENINSATRSFVAIGFYLKHIRDNEMYLQDGYENIWELAQAEFGISKSQASKFMSINDRFSKDGNSPILLDQYKDFSSSKLSEMLYLTDEQLEQVTEATTVVQIREIRKPEKKNNCVIKNDLEGTDLKCSGLEGNKDCLYCEKAEVVSTSKQEEPKKPYYECAAYKQYQYSKGCKGCFYDKADCPYDRTRYLEELKRKEEQSIRYEVLKEMCDALCKMRSYSLEKNNYSMESIQRISRGDESFSFGFGDDGAGHSKYDARFFTKDNSYCAKELHGEGMWDFKAGEVDQQIWNVNGREWHNNHPVMTIDELDLFVSAYNALRKHDIGTVDGLCKHTEKELLEDWKIGSINTRQIVEKLSEIGRSLKPDATETVEIVPEYIKPVIKTEESVINEPESVSDEKSCSGCGYNTVSREDYFTENPASEFPCDGCCAFDNWMPKVDISEPVKTELPCDTCGREIQGCCSYEDTPDDYCVDGDKWIAKEEPVEIVEADIIQTVPDELPKPIFSAEYHLREAIKREEDQLKQLGETWLIKQPDTYLKHQTILIALKCHLTDMEYPNPELKIIHKYQVDPYKEKDIFEIVPHQINTAWSFFDKKDYESADFYLFNARKDLWENDKYEFDRHEPFRPKLHEGMVKQPELPVLKNNDKRKDFIDAYATWPIWIDQKETGERYYRYDLTDKVAMVVRVSKRHVWNNYKQTEKIDFDREEYFLLGIYVEYQAGKMVIKEDDTRTFFECSSNKSALVDYLKEFQKKGTC